MKMMVSGKYRRVSAGPCLEEFQQLSNSIHQDMAPFGMYFFQRIETIFSIF